MRMISVQRIIVIACMVYAIDAHGGSLTFEKTDLDFGDIKATDNASKTIRITNGGDNPVKILRASSSCPCTEAVVKAATLKKGDGVDLMVRLHLSDYSADSVHSYVTVETDDANDSAHRLAVRANVLPEYAAFPKSLDFGRVKLDADPTMTVQLRHQYGPSLKVLRIDAPGDLHVEQKRADDSANGKNDIYEFVIRLLPTKNSGPMNMRIAIITNSKRLFRIEIPVHAERIGVECSIQPKVLVFGPVPPGNELGVFTIESVNSFKIANVDAKDKDILTELETVFPDRKYRLILKVGTFAPPGRKTGKVRIQIQEGSLLESKEVSYYGDIGSPK